MRKYFGKTTDMPVVGTLAAFREGESLRVARTGHLREQLLP